MNTATIEQEAHALAKAGNRVDAIKTIRQALGSLTLAVAWANKHYPKLETVKPSPFDSFYQAPSPLGALNLAISDARANRMPGEFIDQLVKARGMLERRPAVVNVLQRLTEKATRAVSLIYAGTFTTEDRHELGALAVEGKTTVNAEQA